MSLRAYIDDLQKQGRYLFTKSEAMQTLHLSENAVSSSLKRLSQKRKVAHLKGGLYQIISLAYESQGSLPAAWFIHELMAYLGLPYYVGLLSAASFYGAAHQAPQVFQVVCPQPIRELKIHDLKICFYVNKQISQMPTQDLKTPAGYMRVSTPEGTAFDLMRYIHVAGHLNHVATVLHELAEEMSPEKLAAMAPHFSVRTVQRLGYLLEFLGHGSLAESLQKELQKIKPLRYVPLRPDFPAEDALKDRRWHILENETIEPDL